MYRRKIAFLLAAVVLFSISAAAQANFDNELTQYLSQRYKKRMMILRRFYMGEQLKYDPSGNLIGHADEGFWTINGILQINKIRVSNQRLEIQAKRFVLAEIKNKLDFAPSKRETVIVVDFDPRNFTREVVDAALSQIFFNEHDHFEELVPIYWKHCVMAAATGGGGKEDDYCHYSDRFLTLAAVRFTSGPFTPHQVDGSVERIVVASMRPPKQLYAPDPQYSIDARDANAEGIVKLNLVVGSNGTPRDIWIRKPVGYGLDELAIATVETWKFSPALKNGTPVSVVVTVEVNFHLH